MDLFGGAARFSGVLLMVVLAAVPRTCAQYYCSQFFQDARESTPLEFEIEDRTPVGSVVFQFYGPGNAYHSLLLDAGDTDYVAYDPTRFTLVVKKPLYDKLIHPVQLRGKCVEYIEEISNVVPVDVTIIINIADTNDPPLFSNLPAVVRLKENTPFGSLVFKVKMDRSYDLLPRYNRHNFSIEVVDPSLQLDIQDLFMFDRHGNLFLRRKLNYETEDRKQYTFKVTATDHGEHPLSNSSLLTVLLIDVDDIKPQFTHDEYQITLDPSGYQNRTCVEVDPPIQAVDGDVDVPSNIVYSFLIGDDISDPMIAILNNFEVENTTGNICLLETDQNVNISILHNRTILIKASQQDDRTRYDTAPLHIVVEEPNDHVPRFDRAVYTLEVPEYPNVTDGQALLKVHAVDRDQNFNGIFKYKIVAVHKIFDTNVTVLRIHPKTGVISAVNAEFIDREDIDNITFKVLAVETRSKERQSSTATVVFKLLDINDHTPRFSKPIYNFTVLDTLPYGATIPQNGDGVVAIDPDSGDNGKLKYEIEKIWRYGEPATIYDSHRLIIESDTGTIRMATTLSDLRRRKKSVRFGLNVTVSDSAWPVAQRKVSSVVVFIYVQESNEHAPYMLRTKSQGHAQIHESASPGTRVIRLEVRDKDGDEDVFLKYKIVAGNQNKTFKIRQGGWVVVHRRLDRETKDKYYLRIHISDGKHKTRTYLTITILDDNDNAPVFSDAIYRWDIPENIMAGTEVGVIRATDPDEGANGAIRYRVENDHMASIFLVSPEGRITVRASSPFFNREEYEDIQFKVIAEDAGYHPKKTYVLVVLTLLDVNDNTPVFSLMEYQGSIVEDDNNPHPQAVYVDVPIYATDDDVFELNRDVRYSLNGNDSDLFRIDPFDAMIWVKNQGSIDREKMESIIVELVATDRGGDGLSSTAYLIIKVIDVNDNVPYFTSPSEFTLRHSVRVGEKIGHVTARDADAMEPNNQIVYILKQGGFGKFAIDHVTGQISVANNINREPLLDQYELVIEAMDGGLPRKSNVTIVTVHCTVNHPPVILRESTHMRIKEDIKPGTLVGTIRAYDPDNNQMLMFYSDDGEFDDMFSVDTDGQITARTTFDYERRSEYVFGVSVRDNGQPSYVSAAKVTVSVEDVNDHAPRFLLDLYEGMVVEDDHSPQPQQVVEMALQISAVDDDVNSGTRITYSLAGEYHHVFEIDPVTAELCVDRKYAGKIDRETMATYYLKVVATDENGEGESTSVDLHISVLDVNDEAPVFTMETKELVIPRDAEAGDVIGHVTATDADATLPNNLVLYVLEDDLMGKFKIDLQTGAITILPSLLIPPQEESYLLQVTARDSGLPTRQSTIAVSVLNPHPVRAKFPDDRKSGVPLVKYRFSVEEEVPVGTKVGRILSNRSIKQIGIRKLQFTIKAGKTQVPFKIDRVSGILKTAGRLDYDKGKKAYTFKICASETNKKSPACATGNGIVVVFVKDKNDNPPVFSQDVYRHSVSSVFPLATTVATPFAYDSVDTLDSSYSYAILKTDHVLYVDIDRKTGVVTLNENFENIPENEVYLEYTLVATDNDNKKLVAKATLSIKVYFHHPGAKKTPGKSNNIHVKYLRSEDQDHVEGSNSGCCCLVPCNNSNNGNNRNKNGYFP